MTLVPVPGYGPGRLDVEGNLAHYIDRIVLGAHNYHSTKTLGSRGAAQHSPGHRDRTTRGDGRASHSCTEAIDRTRGVDVPRRQRLLALGMICDTWLPINRKLWTTSFSLFMGGLDFVLLAAFIWLVDHLGIPALRAPAGNYGDELHRGLHGVGVRRHPSGPNRPGMKQYTKPSSNP